MKKILFLKYTATIITLVIVYGFLFILNPNYMSYSKTQNTKVYTIGIVNQTIEGAKPSTILDTVKPLQEYFNKHLGANFIVKIVTYDQLNQGLANGTLQFGYVGNYMYVKLKQKHNISPIVKVSNGGSENYKTYIMVRKDSPINSIKDLKGKKFVYFSDQSFHSYIYPKLLISKHFKTDINKFFSSVNKTNNPNDALFSVFYKQNDVVSVSSTTWEIVCELNPRFNNAFKTIDTSPGVVTGPLFYSNIADVNKDDITALSKLLTNMETNVQGRQILMMFKVSKFLPAKDEEYNSLRKLVLSQ